MSLFKPPAPAPYESILEQIDVESSRLARAVLTGVGYPNIIRAELDKLRAQLAAYLKEDGDA